MTNAQYQRTRMKGDPSALITQLRRTILVHARAQGIPLDRAMNDSLVDVRHLCDVWRLDFAALESDAYDGYLEELEYPREAANA